MFSVCGWGLKWSLSFDTVMLCHGLFHLCQNTQAQKQRYPSDTHTHTHTHANKPQTALTSPTFHSKLFYFFSILKLFIFSKYYCYRVYSVYLYYNADTSFIWSNPDGTQGGHSHWLGRVLPAGSYHSSTSTVSLHTHTHTLFIQLKDGAQFLWTPHCMCV